MSDTLPGGTADVPSEAGIYTATLARLYLRQGFLERAAAIYRRLAQEQPENRQLQAQLHALEQQLQREGAESEPGPEPVLPPATVRPPQPASSRSPLAVVTQLERWLDYLQRQRR